MSEEDDNKTGEEEKVDLIGLLTSGDEEEFRKQVHKHVVDAVTREVGDIDAAALSLAGDNEDPDPDAEDEPEPDAEDEPEPDAEDEGGDDDEKPEED